MKRTILCLLALVLCLSLTACGEEEIEPSLPTYKISAWMALPEGISEISRCVLHGEKLLLCCKEETESGSALYYAAEMTTDGNQFSRISLELESKERLIDIAVDAQGELWGLIETPKSETKAKYTLWHFDARNRKDKRVELNDILEREDALHAYADMWLISDAEGRLCLTVGYGRAYCFFFDAAGEYIFSLESEGTPCATVKTGADQFAVCTREGLSYSFSSVDMQKQAWGAKTEIATVSNVFGAEGAADFYLYDSAAFYECGGSGEKTLLFNWADLGLSSGDSHACALGDGRFAVISSSFSQTGVSEYEYCLVEQGEDTRTVLEMVSLKPDSSILDAIARFNKSNSEYRVELRSFFSTNDQPSNEDWNNAIMKFNTEMTSGKIPDIIDLNNMPVQGYLRQGLLEDLYPYIQNDPLISEEDYFANVFAAMSIDGKLPYVTSNVMVLTMFADSQAVGHERGWTIDDFTALRTVGGLTVESASPEWLLERLLCADNRFVNWESGECSFDSAEFISLLELVHSGTGVVSASYELDRDTECFYVNAGSVVDIARYNAQLNWCTNPIGYPGSGKVTHALSPANRVGISSTGEHKDGAWAFVRSFLEAKQQESGGFFPIRIESFEKIAKAATEGKTMWSSLYRGKIYEEDIALAREILNSAAYCMDSSDALIEIVLSATAPYFSGDKSAQQVASEIQQRAVIYVNEQR